MSLPEGNFHVIILNKTFSDILYVVSTCKESNSENVFHLPTRKWQTAVKISPLLAIGNSHNSYIHKKLLEDVQVLITLEMPNNYY